jgi:hypothetical protein
LRYIVAYFKWHYLALPLRKIKEVSYGQSSQAAQNKTKKDSEFNIYLGIHGTAGTLKYKRSTLSSRRRHQGQCL